MVARVLTVAFAGLEPKEVDVQVHIGAGLPALVIVGLVSKAVSEAKERIRAAISSMGLSLPAKRIVVNLAPADFAKEGTRFDLPIAIAILIAMEVLPQEAVDGFVVLGELSLDGNVGGVRGVLPVGMYVLEKGLKLLCPEQNAMECLMLRDKLTVCGASSLGQITGALKGETEMLTPLKEAAVEAEKFVPYCAVDMADIRGQSVAKRAAFVAACGGHNLLLMGHPGTGKSMLAAAFAGILPPLLPEEMIEVTSIYSIAGLLKGNQVVCARPYRAPHHSASGASVIGGGRADQLGEITLAHRGVLFLDELPEFERGVLDSLRQPLENGFVTIARADYRISYPARFQLLSAMNRCKCGYFGDAARQCRKVPQCGLDYESRVSGPIMDRIDIVVDVETESPVFDLDSGGVAGVGGDQSTEALQKKVCAIVGLQFDRYANEDRGFRMNAHLPSDLMDKYCKLDEGCKDVLKKYSLRFGLSMRGYTKVLRVARTIADIEGLEGISKEHIMEALQYRNRLYDAMAKA